MIADRQSLLARRRAALVLEIAEERDRMAALVADLRTQLAVAGLAMLAARLARRSRWLRWLAGGTAIATAALPLLARLVPARR